jgi:hypothetical protein
LSGQPSHAIERYFGRRDAARPAGSFPPNRERLTVIGDRTSLARVENAISA